MVGWWDDANSANTQIVISQLFWIASSPEALRPFELCSNILEKSSIGFIRPGTTWHL